MQHGLQLVVGADTVLQPWLHAAGQQVGWQLTFDLARLEQQRGFRQLQLAGHGVGLQHEGVATEVQPEQLWAAGGDVSSATGATGASGAGGSCEIA